MCLSAPGMLWPHIKFPVSVSMRQTQQVENRGAIVYYFPGRFPRLFPEGFAKLLPIVFTFHRLSLVYK